MSTGRRPNTALLQLKYIISTINQMMVKTSLHKWVSWSHRRGGDEGLGGGAEKDIEMSP